MVILPEGGVLSAANASMGKIRKRYKKNDQTFNRFILFWFGHPREHITSLRVPWLYTTIYHIPDLDVNNYLQFFQNAL